jgi:FeS assembly SUF system protein
MSTSSRKRNKNPEEDLTLEEKIVDALRTVYDPEIPVNIYELGLIYGIELRDGGSVVIRMTLTSPGCPVAGSLPIEVESRLREIPEIASAKVEIVWDPPWNMDMISEAGKLQLGMF